ncbi:MAG: aminotransferase class III-fold pyridoxal phosphate-dependent enzyme [Candidatus Aminicenantes bacterium]|nr:aminotransferase class III-fold pyridoxal phosphate-dependent enzyme [Candidatus Aminicenantes bacterium]NIN18775.1 aminotransferase class III-fold pyridoxal phosphate-dependent enzyme [Candidatus Aminicenantes bacterium]NIN85431.1 aminotransferase class III-fold pyridoxal phosphate-dependent enzyme [Candidatus Aminicenantes bacterium]NIT23584.1 aminotransferase class III-fold pyridoxal phosphate-dependent enzyme [Candidatus Aminicenantes bacterium]
MIHSNQKGIFRAASPETIALMKDFNEKKIHTFLLSTGFISPEAGQVGFLLNECFNRGRMSYKRRRYKTFFGNSPFEALQGAFKIARARQSSSNRYNTSEILVLDRRWEIKQFVDPLERGKEKALIPDILLFKEINDIKKHFLDMAYAPAAVVLRGVKELPAEAIEEIFALCRGKKVVTVLDEPDTDFTGRWVLDRLSQLPDIIVTGAALTGYEIPFGAFSTADDIYLPLNNSMTSMLHTSTCGGNRLVLTRIRDHLLSHVSMLTDNKAVYAYCRKIEELDETRKEAYARYINPALTRLYARAGLDIHPVNAHGSTLTIKAKQGKKEKQRDILDCTASGGVAVRGHNPQDIVQEVLEVHNPEENYWEKLCGTLKEHTNFSHVFPAVSGSTAVDIAITLALVANKDKTRIIVFKGNYSGTNLLSLAATENEPFRQPFLPLYFDVLYIDPMNQRAKEVLKKELESQKVALIWLELFQGQTMRSIPRELLDLIEQYKKDSGYLIGVDEVLTGVYRMGEFLAFKGKNLSPDIIALFKGLTDATFPIGTTLVSDKVYQQALSVHPGVVNLLENLYVNQLGAHISLHTLEKLHDSGINQHVENVSQLILTGLKDIAGKSPFIREVSGEGMIFGLNFAYESKILKFMGQRARQTGQALFPLVMNRLCQEKAGVFSHFTRLSPALTITNQEVRLLLHNLEKLLCKPSGILFIKLYFLSTVYRKLRRRKRRTKPSKFHQTRNKLFVLVKFILELFKPRGAADYYSGLGDDVIEELDSGFKDIGKSLWFNNGYWKDARTYPAACAALAKLVSDEAKLNADDTVLDAGFGFAEQDFFWLELYNVARIVGINITPLQVKIAEQRVKERNLQGRIELHLGDAADIQFEDESFEKVLALESPFHFNTREDFFREAFRVLKPGGILAATDMLPEPGATGSGFLKRLFRRHGAYPSANMYDRNVYARKLKEAGFVNVSVQSIAEYVLAGSTKYIAMRQLRKLDMESAIVELTTQDMESSQWREVRERAVGITDYVLVSAQKPG